MVEVLIRGGWIELGTLRRVKTRNLEGSALGE